MSKNEQEKIADFKLKVKAFGSSLIENTKALITYLEKVKSAQYL